MKNKKFCSNKFFGIKELCDFQVFQVLYILICIKMLYQFEKPSKSQISIIFVLETLYIEIYAPSHKISYNYLEKYRKIWSVT